MSSNTIVLRMMGAAVLVASCERVAHALVCKEDPANIDDVQAFAAFYGCSQERSDFAWYGFDLSNGTWDQSGHCYDYPCNLNFGYAKFVTAVSALRFWEETNRSDVYHTSDDYLFVTLPTNTMSHVRFNSQYVPSSDEAASGFLAAAMTEWYQNRRVDYYCPTMSGRDEWMAIRVNGGKLLARMASMVHETWHHWLRTRSFSGDHLKCGGSDCDYWYPHGSFVFHPLGPEDLNWYQLGSNGSYKTFHSPYQVETEFACDVSNDTVANWGTFSFKLGARKWANNRMAGRIKNGVFFTCGFPRPY